MPREYRHIQQYEKEGSMSIVGVTRKNENE